MAHLGEFNTGAVFMRPIVSKSDEGAAVRVYEQAFETNVKAKRKNRYGGVLEGGGYALVEVTEVTVRGNDLMDGINKDWLIVMRGRDWNIVGVDIVGLNNRQWYIITVKEKHG